MLNKTEYIQRIEYREHIKPLADRRFHTFEGMVTVDCSFQDNR